MSYEPYKDYFGLSSVVWGSSYLDTIIEPPACRADANASLINRDMIVPSDPLERIRSDAAVDFSHNGVDTDLDFLDVYRTQLRMTGTADFTTPTVMPEEPTAGFRHALINSAPTVMPEEPTAGFRHALINSAPTVMREEPTAGSRRRRGKKEKKHCVFCRNNGESDAVYKSHVLKDNQGRTTCPILRRYTCPLCRASGDTAHTIRYCPANQGGLGSGSSLLLLPDLVTAGSWPTGQ